METSNLCYKTEHPDQNEKTNPIPSWGYNERLIGGDKPRGFRVNSGSNEGVEEHSYGIEEKITLIVENEIIAWSGFARVPIARMDMSVYWINHRQEGISNFHRIDWHAPVAPRTPIRATLKIWVYEKKVQKEPTHPTAISRWAGVPFSKLSLSPP